MSTNLPPEQAPEDRSDRVDVPLLSHLDLTGDTPSSAPFAQVNVEELRLDEPTGFNVAEAKDLSPLQASGERLAKRMLIIISAVIAALFISIGISEFFRPPAEVAALSALAERASAHYFAASSPEALRAANDVVARLVDARKASRDFWSSIGQHLLNLLLPVLTAILGYIFGTSKSEPQ